MVSSCAQRASRGPGPAQRILEVPNGCDAELVIHAGRNDLPVAEADGDMTTRAGVVEHQRTTRSAAVGSVLGAGVPVRYRRRVAEIVAEAGFDCGLAQSLVAGLAQVVVEPLNGLFRPVLRGPDRGAGVFHDVAVILYDQSRRWPRGAGRENRHAGSGVENDISVTLHDDPVGSTAGGVGGPRRPTWPVFHQVSVGLHHQPIRMALGPQRVLAGLPGSKRFIALPG